MLDAKYQQLTENGYEERNLEVEVSEHTSESISSVEEWDKHFGINEFHESFLKSITNKACIKTTITSVTFPFQTKTEMTTRCVTIPLNGKICTDVPQFYRRDVLYRTFAEVCYPVDLLLANVEKCAKQGALAATVAAASGNFPAATVAFQAAFLACMAFSNASDAQKISIRVAGEKEYGQWKPV